MTYSTDNIDHVSAIAFPAGQLRDGTMVPLPGLILLKWHSSATDRLFQAYVNGRLAGATVVPEQRMLLVQYDHTHTAAIEIIAVTPNNRDKDYGPKLCGFKETDGCHVVLSWPRRGCLPLGSTAQVYWNGGSGDIDYGKPLATQAIWPDIAEKWGWGLDAFGNGDFGYSGNGAPGWGRGSFGEGEFGFDADMLSFRSEPLGLGKYAFVVRLFDGAGNIDEGGVAPVEIGVDPLPVAPNVTIENYDDTHDKLVLDIS